MIILFQEQKQKNKSFTSLFSQKLLNLSKITEGIEQFKKTNIKHMYKIKKVKVEQNNNESWF